MERHAYFELSGTKDSNEKTNMKYYDKTTHDRDERNVLSVIAQTGNR